jgi:CRP-like cAMP-binding protein
VFHDADPGDSVHFIEEGRVIVRRTTPDGHRAAFAVMGPGECFGELALLSPSARRTASVEALEPTTTHVLSATAFRELAREHPPVNQLLVTLLAARVERLSDHLVQALYGSVELRVRGRLVELARAFGLHDGSGVIPLTQSDLADLVGASRPATNRVLRRMQDDGVLALSRGRIELTALEPAQYPRRPE